MISRAIGYSDLTKNVRRKNVFPCFVPLKVTVLLKADEKDGMGNTLYTGSLKVKFILFDEKIMNNISS